MRDTALCARACDPNFHLCVKELQMQRVNRSSAVPSMPAPPTGGLPGYFTGGNPGSGTPATTPGYEWFNAVQEELMALIQRGGITASNADLAQVRKSLDRLFGGGVATYAANTTLTVDDAGLVLVNASGGARTITLPAANALGGRPIQIRIVKSDSTANLVAIARAGSDTIEGATSIALRYQWDTLTLISDGISGWMVSAGGIGARNISTPGWARIPGGLMFQWGQATIPANGSVLITLPVAYPQVFLRALAVIELAVAGGSTPPVGWEFVSLSQFRIYNGSAGGGVSSSWFSIGA
jgi:hypothetical protein